MDREDSPWKDLRSIRREFSITTDQTYEVVVYYSSLGDWRVTYNGKDFPVTICWAKGDEVDMGAAERAAAASLDRLELVLIDAIPGSHKE